MHIAILAMGPSADAYARHAAIAGDAKAEFDETWTVNAFGSVFHADRIFHMDDVRIQEIRAKAGNEQVANMLKWLKTHPGPIYTSRAHPDYPGLVEYPLEEVINYTGNMPYFNSTPAYALGFAMYLKSSGQADIQRVSCYGMDYAFNDKYRAERGRSCIEYWLGRMTERKIEFTLPRQAWLLDTNRKDRLYGYDTRSVSCRMGDDGKYKLTFSERKDLPTAEEIEAAYSTECGPVKEKANGKCGLPFVQNGPDQCERERLA
jgi:hypothetical protein